MESRQSLNHVVIMNSYRKSIERHPSKDRSYVWTANKSRIHDIHPVDRSLHFDRQIILIIDTIDHRAKTSQVFLLTRSGMYELYISQGMPSHGSRTVIGNHRLLWSKQHLMHADSQIDHLNDQKY